MKNVLLLITLAFSFNTLCNELLYLEKLILSEEEKEHKRLPITEGTRRKIVWENPKNPKKTPLAVLSLHGFSATRKEIEPLPQMLAKDLGANLYLNRLPAHGQKGDLFSGVSYQDWVKDVENDLKIAIPPFIIATLIALIVVYFLEKRIPMVPLVSGVLITLFGGLTLYFDNKIFFYMKPTIINLLFAGILFFGKFFSQKPLLKIFFQTAFNLEDEGWKKLNDRWIFFFIFVAILNEIVWRTQSEAFWVNFKVWGLLPISFLFAASQIALINKYKLKQ